MNSVDAACCPKRSYLPECLHGAATLRPTCSNYMSGHRNVLDFNCDNKLVTAYISKFVRYLLDPNACWHIYALNTVRIFRLHTVMSEAHEIITHVHKLTAGLVVCLCYVFKLTELHGMWQYLETLLWPVLIDESRCMEFHEVPCAYF